MKEQQKQSPTKQLFGQKRYKRTTSENGLAKIG
jgi:hypothetical protein